MIAAFAGYLSLVVGCVYIPLYLAFANSNSVSVRRFVSVTFGAHAVAVDTEATRFFAVEKTNRFGLRRSMPGIREEIT